MRRRVHRPASLTSMIDVMFILVFAALAQRAVSASPSEEPGEDPASGGPATPGAADAAPGDGSSGGVSDFASLRRAGLAAAASSLERGEAVVVRVSSSGSVTAIETTGGSQLISVPLLERVADPDIALTYLGDRSPELRLCAVAARYAAVDGQLVVVAIEGRIDDLRVALVAGLRRDQSRCRDHGGMAVMVEAGEDPGP